MPANIVEARGITKTFGKTDVLKGIDLAVPEGTVLALLGPNGAGKTTTVRILTTLLKPDSGTITVAGYDVRRDPDKVTTGASSSPTRRPGSRTNSAATGWISSSPTQRRSNRFPKSGKKRSRWKSGRGRSVSRSPRGNRG